MKIYSVKDDKSQTFQGVYSFPNDALCIREFDSAYKQGKLGLINQYPGDFAIYEVAKMDEETGVVVPELQHIKNFSDYQAEAAKNAGN